ncbi:MAG: sporulation transcriptional regulator SpoIIID, partial [Clostridia bacterium]|nr:sporulation transcriptional regulator SpoIIID [Clostridia bacterium]
MQTNQTVRQTADVYGISKSTVHNDVSKKLQKI